MLTDDRAEFLEAVCSVDSRTVDGAEGTVRVAEMFAERLAPMGFDMEWIDASFSDEPRGKHLKAVRNPGAPTRVVLMGHTDTVLSPADAPFRREPRTGRACGAGVCDMKGGCVILLDAARTALAESPSVRDASLVVLLDCSEELSGPSFPELARETARGAAACLSFEPVCAGPNGELQVVVARKGVVRFGLTCFGRAAHAGNDHEIGVNAIRELARKIEQIEALTDYERGVSANVGCIRGGRVPNQVADEAFASFEARAFESDVLDGVCDAVKEICSAPTVRSPADGTATRLELTEHRSYPPWPQSDGTDGLARRYAALARERGSAATPARRGGGSDASHVAGLAPTLDGLGMIGGGMHAPNEWADATTLPLRARLAADLIVDICARRDPTR